MSGITLKIASLLIRTLAKPIANQIKVQAREHDGFRRTCVNFAQSVHRVDMRLRLGLLQDHAAIERQIARDAKEAAAAAAAKKQSSSIPTVKTEAQMKADENSASSGDSGSGSSEKTAEQAKAEKKAAQPKIRPLGEAKAIELGANFFSETFIFSVAVGLLIFERWYSSRKEKGRRNDLAENLAELEERDRLHGVELEMLKQEVTDLRGRERRYWGVLKRAADGRGEEEKEKREKDDNTERKKGNLVSRESASTMGQSQNGSKS